MIEYGLTSMKPYTQEVTSDMKFNDSLHTITHFTDVPHKTLVNHLSTVDRLATVAIKGQRASTG